MHCFLSFFVSSLFFLFFLFSHHRALTMFNIVAGGRCPSLERLRLHQCSAHKISQLMFCAYWNYGNVNDVVSIIDYFFFYFIRPILLAEVAKWSNICFWQKHFHVLLSMGNHCFVDRSGQWVKRAIRIRCGRKMFVPSTFLYPHGNSLAWSPYIFLFHVLKVNTYCSRPAKDTGSGRCPLWIPCPSTSKYTLKGESPENSYPFGRGLPV